MSDATQAVWSQLTGGAILPPKPTDESEPVRRESSPGPVETVTGHVNGERLEMYVDGEGDLRIEIDHEAAGWFRPDEVVKALANIGVLGPEQAMAAHWTALRPELARLTEAVEQMVEEAKRR